MKRHLQCAEQQVSRSNLTKCCACHANWLACLILVTYEASFTMRGATSVTIQPHQRLRLPRRKTRMLHPRDIWNVIYNARRNRCHDPTSPNSSSSHMKRHLHCAEQQVSRSNLTKDCAGHEIAKFQRNFRKTGETSFTMRGRSDHDPTMKPSVRNPPRNRGYHFRVKNTTVRAPAIVQKLTKCCACHTKSHSNFTKCWTRHKKLHLNFTKCCTCHEKWDLNFTKYCLCHEKCHLNILRLARKVSLELHQVLHAPRKVTLELRQVLHLPRKAWTSPSAAPAHENRRLSFTSYTAPFKKNDLPNIVAATKNGPCHIWNLIYNAESNRTRARRYYSLTLLFCDSTILLLFYSVPLLLCVSSFLWLYYLWADKVVLFCDSTSLSLLHSSTLLYCCSFTLLFFFSTFLLRYHSLILLISYSTILWVYFFVITLFFVLLVFYPSFLWLYYSFILPFCDCTRLLL